MANINDLINSFLKPVGSVDEITDVTNVIGSGGGLRHRGSFSPDNPYLPQLSLAVKNQDKDALYEMAIKWEAQRSQDQWQLDVNRDILEEQRAYDDPSARIARDRRAGINPDLSGTSSGSSSGGSTSIPYTAPDSPDIANTTRFSNQYDNIAQVLSTIQTVTSVAESAGRLVSMFSLLPSQLRISNAQADLAEGTLDSAKSLARSQASSAELSALNDRIDFVGRLAQFVQPNSDEATVRNLFTSLGVSPDNLDSVYGLYNHYKNSDSMQSVFNERQLRRKDTEARNMAYTSTLLQGIYTNEAEATNLRMQSQFYIEQVQEAINSVLAESENIDVATQTAKNTLISEQESSRLQLGKIVHELKAFDKYQQFIKATIKVSKDNQKNILAGRSYSDLKSEDQALYNKETLRQWSLFTCGSDSTQQVVDILNSYIKDTYRRSKGNVADPTTGFIMTPSDFVNSYFGDVKGSSSLTDIFTTAVELYLKKGLK